MLYTEKNSTVKRPGTWIFVSDVHLGAKPVEQNTMVEKDLINLVSFCRDRGFEIILLGDFFDYWMEYPGFVVPPLGQNILQHFNIYHKETNKRTLFVTGNHDNWTNGYLPSIGFDLEHEYRILEDNDFSLMVMHGDGLSDPQTKFPRPFAHRLLRNSYFVSFYKWLFPPKTGWFLMRLFSNGNKKFGDKRIGISRRNRLGSWARQFVEKNEHIQAIVCGHLHKPSIWSHNGNTVMNCGSFRDKRSLGMYTDKKFKIVTWDSSKRMLA